MGPVAGFPAGAAVSSAACGCRPRPAVCNQGAASYNGSSNNARSLVMSMSCCWLQSRQQRCALCIDVTCPASYAKANYTLRFKVKQTCDIAQTQGYGAVYGVLLSDAGIVALASQPEQPRLHPSDLLLLATFLRSNDSLRQVRPQCCFHFLRVAEVCTLLFENVLG
jgi:hypothetical protein